MGAFTTMTSKGQVTIPKDMRERLNLTAGTRLYMTEVEGKIVAMPKNKKITDLFGILGDLPQGMSLNGEKIDETIMDYVGHDDERIKREWQETHS
jgi:antitoxin PrlF